MPTHRVTLEMTKSYMGPTPVIEVRVGDADQTIEATLLDGGLPYEPPEGAKVLFQVKRPDGGLARSMPLTAGDQPNVFTGPIPSQSFVYHGVSREAYVAVYHGDDPGPTSQTVQLVILPGTTDEIAVDYFDARINAMANDLEADVEANRQSFAAAQREREEEFDRAQREQQETFDAAEKKREDGEAARKAAEEKRDEAEKARASAEELRASEETARGNAESERDTAEKARVQAETTRRGDEETRQEQEQARQTAEQKRAEAEVERGTAEGNRAEAETARVAAETERASAEEGRERAETDRESGETDREDAERERVEAEGKRVEAETARDAAERERATAEEGRQSEFAANEESRKAAEAARAKAEGERESAEQARAEAEGKRAVAETERGDAEQAREAAEEERVAADAERAERQTANDTRQAKNDADQAANNLAAQGRLTRILQEGEYDPETREPTIEGDLTHVFAVPTKESEVAAAALETAKANLKRVEREMADAAGDAPSFDGQVTKAQSALEAAQIAYEAANRYVEWLWLLGGDGQGYWELYGSGNSTLPDPVSTEEIDRMWAGESVETKHVAYSSGVAYDITKTKSAIADAISAHDTNMKEWVQSASKAKDAEHADKASSAETAGTADKLGSETVGSATEPIYLNEGTATAIPKVGKASVADKLGTATVGSEKQPIYLKDGVPTPGGAEIDLVTKEAAGIVPPLPEDASLEKGYALGWSDEGKAVWIEAKGEAQLPDPRELRALIESSNTKKSGAKVKGSGDYTFGTQVTTREAIDAFGKAIDAAQAVSDEYYSQKELDEATEALRQANSTFDATLTALAPDKSGLTSEESRYTQLKSGVSVSTNGKDIAFGGKWVTASEQSAADTALTTARNAVNSATKQSEITTAVSTFKSAVDTYSSAIKTATKDTAALESAISAANTAKTDVQTSETEGSDLPSGSKYVTTAQMKALTDAISAAQSAKTTASTQKAIDDATSALTAATATFSGQVKTNWSEPSKLSGASADDLARICDLAKEDGDTYYQKYGGQTFTIAMQNTTYSASTITVRCDDAANMDAVAGGKNGLHFTIIQGLKPQQMSSSATTSGGYKGSNFYTKILPEIIKALPQEFQDRLEDLYVDVNLASSGTTITPVAGKMHLVTMKQWFGQSNIDSQSWTSACRAWWDKEEEWLKWNAEHNTNNDRIIKNDSGSACSAWTSSVYNSTSFGNVYSGGTPNSSVAAYSYVPVLGFSLTNG